MNFLSDRHTGELEFGLTGTGSQQGKELYQSLFQGSAHLIPMQN